MHLKIKNLPNDERPYEKFLKYGVSSLSDTELISVLLKTGTKNVTCIELAREVLRDYDNSSKLSNLYNKTFEELKSIPGIGEVKAITLKCVAEISKRLSTSKYTDDFVFDNPKDIANYYMESLRHLKVEEFIVLFLNNRNRYITSRVMTIGTHDESLVSVKDVFSYALKVEAVNIVLIHNHPSGDVTPSNEDMNVTNNMVSAGKIIGIDVLDHIIIGDKTYLSFRECDIFPI